MGNRKAARTLRSLERIVRRYGPDLAAGKLALLAELDSARLANASQLRRLHELLCFLDAYPDNRRMHGRVRRMLREFARRPDLLRHRVALAGSGIAGTDTPYRFFWPTAHWITQQWPGAVVLDRKDRIATQDILAALPSLLGSGPALWMRKQSLKTLAALDKVRPRGLTDAEFIIRLIARMPGDEFSREAFGDRLDLSYLLRAGRGTPERTTQRFDAGQLHFQTAQLQSTRPDLRTEAQRAPRRIRRMRGRSAESLIRLARISMITRERDLAAFQFANPDDVFLVEDGAGIEFAMMGMIPSRRAVLPATYAALTLKNGVPIGYVQVDVLGRHAALHFNTFETFRGGEAARIFARVVAMVRHVFGCDEFSIEPYQLGADNEEGIATGAWWFYHRFGFRPRSIDARGIAAREVARLQANGKYHSPPRILRRLAKWHLFFALDPDRQARLPRTGKWLNSAMAPGQWGPLIRAWTTTGRWSDADRQLLARLAHAKTGRSERDFQRLLLRHTRLRALLDC